MSYISSLNLLNADSPAPISEDLFQEELSLWANAQFSFDTAPGSALTTEEDKKEEDLLSTLTKLTQLVQPNIATTANVPSVYYPSAAAAAAAASASATSNILPRIAPAPGPTSGVHMLETTNLLKDMKNKKRSIDDDADIGVDDDKRRRNTAASARFRMKKKLREQALEKTTKEMADNVEKLETKVKELEMEAKWLRALVIEKDPKLLAKKDDKEQVANEEEEAEAEEAK